MVPNWFEGCAIAHLKAFLQRKNIFARQSSILAFLGTLTDVVWIDERKRCQPIKGQSLLLMCVVAHKNYAVTRCPIWPPFLFTLRYLGHKCGANTFSNYLMVAYQCVPSSSIHDICQSTFHVSDNNGFIISPGYPSPYYKGMSNVWLLRWIFATSDSNCLRKSYLIFVYRQDPNKKWGGTRRFSSPPFNSHDSNNFLTSSGGWHLRWIQLAPPWRFLNFHLEHP